MAEQWTNERIAWYVNNATDNAWLSRRMQELMQRVRDEMQAEIDAAKQPAPELARVPDGGWRDAMAETPEWYVDVEVRTRGYIGKDENGARVWSTIDYAVTHWRDLSAQQPAAVPVADILHLCGDGDLVASDFGTHSSEAKRVRAWLETLGKS